MAELGLVANTQNMGSEHGLSAPSVHISHDGTAQSQPHFPYATLEMSLMILGRQLWRRSEATKVR